MSRTANPYSTLEIPNLDRLRTESRDLAELHAREFRLLKEYLSTEGLMVMIRENDRIEAEKVAAARERSKVTDDRHRL
ncbi:hypothetical protein JCM10212_005570 [Sporobolomyces blumeae]